METLPALVRALAEVVKNKVDVINMSFGEATTVADQGFFIRLANQVVNKHGIIFVVSAGNAGPALSTAGAPGVRCPFSDRNLHSRLPLVFPRIPLGCSLLLPVGIVNCVQTLKATSDSIFAVGAYVTDTMMRTCYAMPKRLTEGYATNFTWTSVGPAQDGGRGTQIMAPGGAITCVPNWTLAHSQLMNGTSMSSPNCAGNFALLLSGCKAEGIAYTPHRVQRAVKNTGALLSNVTPVAQGHGVMQTESAYAYIKKFAADSIEDVEFKVKVGGQPVSPSRGIYLREGTTMAAPSTHMIYIEPKLHEDAPKADRVAFEVRVRLEADAEYITIPDQMVLQAKQGAFKIFIDPTKLEPGLHCANVKGYDAQNPERGPLFSVPITITKPVQADGTTTTETISFQRGDTRRIFVTPPDGATWMDIGLKINKLEPATSKSLVLIHTVQMLPFQKHQNTESKNYVQLFAGQKTVVSRKVDGRNTVEICVASYWSATAAQEVELEYTFHGVRPCSEQLTIQGGSGMARTDVVSHVREVQLLAAASLDKWQTPIRPTKSSIAPLAEQWHLPEAEVLHQLELEYSLTIDEATEITPRCPVLNNVVYESELLGGPFFFVHDARKKLLGYGDIYPEAIKVPKGVITIHAFLRHTSVELLKRYEGLVFAVERKLTKKVIISCYDGYNNLAKNGNKFLKQPLRQGMCAAVFFAEPEHKDLPKEAKAGDTLIGVVTYASDDEKMVGAGKRPGGYPISYTVPPPPAKKEEKKKAEAVDPRTDAEKLSEAVRDLTVKTLTGLSGKDGFDAVYATAAAQYADHLPLAQAKLAHVDAEESRKEKLDEVVAAADVVIAMIDQTELALHFGTNVDADDVDAVKAQKEFETKKKALIDALARKARAIGQTIVPDATAAGGAAAIGGAGAGVVSLTTDAAATKPKEVSPFMTSLKELRKWDKVDHTNHPKLSVEADARDERHGAVLKAASAGLAKCVGAFDKELLEYRAAAYEKLGWTHAAEYEKMCRLLNSPKAFPLF
jgi:tripeptidyl-peptidase-2